MLLECACHSDEHALKFTLYKWDDGPEICTSVFLSRYHNIFGRIWVAIKYVFGYKCKYGHWDCFLLRPKDADRLITILKKYEQMIKELEDGKTRKKKKANPLTNAITTKIGI